MIFKNKFWWCCTTLFVLHQISQYILAWNIPCIDSYADPFLGMICLLGLILQERRVFLHFFIDSQKATHYRFSILETLIITFVLALLFEEGFPRWSEHFTKDYWDYLGYFGGAGVFLVFVNE